MPNIFERNVRLFHERGSWYTFERWENTIKKKLSFENSLRIHTFYFFFKSAQTWPWTVVRAWVLQGNKAKSDKYLCRDVEMSHSICAEMGHVPISSSLSLSSSSGSGGCHTKQQRAEEDDWNALTNKSSESHSHLIWINKRLCVYPVTWWLQLLAR